MMKHVCFEIIAPGQPLFVTDMMRRFSVTFPFPTKTHDFVALTDRYRRMLRFMTDVAILPHVCNLNFAQLWIDRSTNQMLKSNRF